MRPESTQPERKEANPTLFKVAVVSVSTSFAGRNGRRVHTDLVLVNGHDKVRVQVNDNKFTKYGRASADWNVGEMVEAPDVRGRKFVTLMPSQMKIQTQTPKFEASELRQQIE